MTNRKNLYGYCIENGELTIVLQEAQTVKRIAMLYIAGASYQTIADSLNKSGTPFSQEAPLWNKHKVKRVLENPRYIGTNGYPPILDEADFQAVQANIKAKTDGYTCFLLPTLSFYTCVSLNAISTTRSAQQASSARVSENSLSFPCSAFITAL